MFGWKVLRQFEALSTKVYQCRTCALPVTMVARLPNDMKMEMVISSNQPRQRGDAEVDAAVAVGGRICPGGSSESLSTQVLWLHTSTAAATHSA